MKIIGLDGREYKSEKECLIADKKFNEKKELDKKLMEEEKLKVSNRKKELANKVQEATDKVDYYTNEYIKVKADARKFLEEANKQAQDMLSKAAKQVEEASNEKLTAISNFNKEFGPYKTVLTGNEAIAEYNKVMQSLDETFSKVFKDIFTWRF